MELVQLLSRRHRTSAKLTGPRQGTLPGTMPRPTMTRNTATREEPKPDIDPRTGKPDWSRYNATIVGNAPLQGAPLHPAYAPGLEATQGPNARPPPYRNVSFAATREYADDEGWQHVGKSRRGRRARAWRGKSQEETAQRGGGYDALAEAEA